jgi:hypothetical protein
MVETKTIRKPWQITPEEIKKIESETDRRMHALAQDTLGQFTDKEALEIYEDGAMARDRLAQLKLLRYLMQKSTHLGDSCYGLAVVQWKEIEKELGGKQ